MNDKTFSFLVSILIFGAIYLTLFWLLALLLPSFNGAAKAGVLGGITALVAPRYKRYDVQGEKRSTFKWILKHH